MKKLNLEKLKVKSFVTTGDQMNTGTVKGGTIIVIQTVNCLIETVACPIDTLVCPSIVDGCPSAPAGCTTIHSTIVIKPY